MPANPPSQKHIIDGFRVLDGGMDQGVSPQLLKKNQCSYAENTTFRGGFAMNRPKFRKIRIFKNSGVSATALKDIFQGACFYKPDKGNESLVAQIGGNLFQFQFSATTDVFMVDRTIPGDPNDPNVRQAWLWQAEQWVICNDGIHLPIYWDGSSGPTSTRRSIGPQVSPSTATSELPISRMGCYGMGRNWVALPDGRSFIAGDIVNWSSGTIAFNFRDAVLKASANDLVVGGGSFVVPGAVDNITAMAFMSVLDASLGQGPLQVLTPACVFSCSTPVDQSVWQFITNPILTESLIGSGGLGQNSTTAVDGDLYFRAPEGIRSLIQGRKDFYSYANTPISNEVSTVLSGDDQNLLQYGSAIYFDDRWLMTAHPVVGDCGVYHDTLIAMDRSPISSLRGKAPSIYDGVWKDLNVLQLLRGRVSGKLRAFAFTFNATTSEIEIWEILNDYDSIGVDPVTWEIEGPPLFIGQEQTKNIFDACRLVDGEIYVDSIQAATTFEVSYRPDYATGWQPWYTTTVAAGKTYATRLGLGEPPVVPNPETDTPFNIGYTFQVKIRVTGAAQIIAFKAVAVMEPTPQFSQPA